MAISKSKKRKIEKKKNLPIIDPEFIKANQCWLPNYRTDYNYESNSWFNIATISKIFADKSSKSHWVGETDTMRVERIEIYPTPEQKIKLLDWFETYRRLYNLTVTHRSKFMNKGYMRSYENFMRPLVQKELLPNYPNLSHEIHKTLLPKNQRIYEKIPLHTIRNAINDVKKAFDSAKANQKAGNIKSFRLRHKKVTNPVRTMVIEQDTFAKTVNAFAKTALGEMKSSKLFGKVNHDCRLAYSYLTDKFILWKPYTKTTVIDHSKYDLIALDPGMRSFQNGYSPSGLCYKFATEKTNIKIRKLLHKIDDVDKEKVTRNGKKGNYKKFTKRIRKKVSDMVTDLHWKLANFLCKNFNTILVGNMSTTGIVKKEKSVLTAFDKKYCIALSHYKFRERLLSKAQEHDVNCKIVDESYTTQTCGVCGQRNLKVGSAKTFKCIDKICGFRCDRDYNAGRNIYLKALSKNLV